ncbi:MAG: hypothetical protein ACRCXB_25820 [Aeromonadaceae bacterium]
MIASSMAGTGQLVAGSADPVHLVALVLDGHGGTGSMAMGEPVSSCWAPIGPVATVPWTPGKEVYCWPGGTVAQLQVIVSSMAGAGQLVAGSVDLVALLPWRLTPAR